MRHCNPISDTASTLLNKLVLNLKGLFCCSVLFCFVLVYLENNFYCTKMSVGLPQARSAVAEQIGFSFCLFFYDSMPLISILPNWHFFCPGLSFLFTRFLLIISPRWVMLFLCSVVLSLPLFYLSMISFCVTFKRDGVFTKYYLSPVLYLLITYLITACDTDTNFLLVT